MDGMNSKPAERKMRGEPIALKEVSCLGDFATQQTMTLLSCLKISDSRFPLPSEKWIENEKSKQDRETIRQLSVVNDVAERVIQRTQLTHHQ